MNPADCCTTCRLPPPCTANLDGLVECGAGIAPQIDPATGCPNCRPPVNTPCTDANCASIPPCAADQQPTFDATRPCCPSCKAPRPCDPSFCNANLGAIRLCADGERPIFERDTCCISCRPGDANLDPATCTADARRQCINDAEICDPGQEFVADPTTSCCAACVPPQARCGLDDLIKCRQNARPCASGEYPVNLENSCCISCIPPRPTCDPECVSPQVCVPGPVDASGDRTTQCVDTEEVRIRITAGTEVSDEDAQGIDAEGAQEVVRQLIDRIGMEADYYEKYARFGALARLLQCNVVEVDLRTRDLTCNVPKESDNAIAGRAASDINSPATLTTASLNAVNSGGFAATPAPPPSTSSASAVLPCLAAALVLLIACLAAL